MHFITFSRKIGTNGSEIVKRVAEHLGYAFYDTEAIEKAASVFPFKTISPGGPYPRSFGDWE